MKKFYRVTKDNFLWKKGAVLKENNEGTNGGYRPISDIWDATEDNGDEYISRRIVENNPEWFERVYEVNLLTKTIYKVKEEAQKLYEKEYKD